MRGKERDFLQLSSFFLANWFQIEASPTVLHDPVVQSVLGTPSSEKDGVLRECGWPFGLRTAMRISYNFTGIH